MQIIFILIFVIIAVIVIRYLYQRKQHEAKIQKCKKLYEEWHNLPLKQQDEKYHQYKELLRDCVYGIELVEIQYYVKKDKRNKITLEGGDESIVTNLTYGPTENQFSIQFKSLIPLEHLKFRPRILSEVDYNMKDKNEQEKHLTVSFELPKMTPDTVYSLKIQFVLTP